MRKTKLIKTEDGELSIQLTDEGLSEVCWKEGDKFEWVETKDGYELILKKA